MAMDTALSTAILSEREFSAGAADLPTSAAAVQTLLQAERARVVETLYPALDSA